jgi:hypothetical protein
MSASYWDEEDNLGRRGFGDPLYFESRECRVRIEGKDMPCITMAGTNKEHTSCKKHARTY